MSLTPSKLSSQYKKLMRAQRNSPKSPDPSRTESPKPAARPDHRTDDEIIVISSSDDEKENKNPPARKSSNSLSSRNSRRNSTILAGNLTIFDSDEEDDRPSVLGETTNRTGPSAANRSRFGGPKRGLEDTARLRAQPLQEITEDEDEDDLITEDETNFFSCEDSKDGSPLNRGGIINTLGLSTRSQDADVTLQSKGLSVAEGSRGRSNVSNRLEGSRDRSNVSNRLEGSRDRSNVSKSLEGSGRSAESLKLALSETTVSDVRYTKTPGILLPGNQESPDRTPTNNMDRITSTVKASRIFSVGKAPTERREGRLLVGGSESDSDEDKPMQTLSKKLSFNKFRDSPRHVACSDEDLPSPRLLSTSKIARVNSWLSGVSTPPMRDSVDGLLDSSNEQNDSNVTEDETLPNNSRTSNHSLDRKRSREQNILEDRSEGAWKEDSLSQGTSKDGGSWNQDSYSQGTSKAGGSWNATSSQATSKSTRTWNDQSLSQGTSKAAGSLNGSTGTSLVQGTSKANGSVRTFSYKPQGSSKVNGSVQNSLYSQGTSKANGSFRNSSRSQDTSKAGGSWNDFKSGTQESVFSTQGTSKAGGSFNNSETEYVPLTYVSINSSQRSIRGNIVYGNDSVEFAQPLQQPVRPVHSAAIPKPKSTNKVKTTVQRGTKKNVQSVSMTLENLTIDNSVNAVRAWTPKQEQDFRSEVRSQVSSQVSEGVEKHGNRSSSDDDDLDRFLSNLKSSRNSKARIPSDDDNFVVPDDESSGADTPEVSLKDRILKRRDPSGGLSTPKSLKPRNLDLKGHRKAPLENDSDGKSRIKPGRTARTIQKPVTISDDSDEDLPSPDVVKTKPKRATTTAKKNVIRSDSESSSTPYIPSGSGSDRSPARKPKTSTAQAPVFATPKNIRPSKKSTVKKLEGAEMVGSPTTLTFLSSLTIDTPKYRCHPDAYQYVSNFKKKKEELGKRLYHLYNKEIFEGALPGDMEISWNVRLTKTAGLCYSKRYRNKFDVETRSSRIELSSKVIDSGDRLRDTLIHEMCHAASWIISGYRDGHGPLWRTWAEKAMHRFKELPVIDRCHSYQIRTKFSYVCESCSYTIGRHSKSLDTEKKVCGHCHGKFKLVVNATSTNNKENNANGVTGSAPKTPNAFALFVKENYKHHKKEGVTHKNVMEVLSLEFKKFKLNK